MPNKIPKVALLDNHDSFIHNIVHEIAVCECNWRLFKHDSTSVEEILSFEPTHIVLGPGPGRPQDATVMMELIDQTINTTPILGICLGHQALGLYFGGKLGHAPGVHHGKPDTIDHTGRYLFAGLPSPLQIGRYHSLHVHSLPEPLEVVARSSDGCIQAFGHPTLPVFGIQFHPESILSKDTGPIWTRFLSQDFNKLC